MNEQVRQRRADEDGGSKTPPDEEKIWSSADHNQGGSSGHQKRGNKQEEKASHYQGGSSIHYEGQDHCQGWNSHEKEWSEWREIQRQRKMLRAEKAVEKEEHEKVLDDDEEHRNIGEDSGELSKEGKSLNDPRKRGFIGGLSENQCLTPAMEERRNWKSDEKDWGALVQHMDRRSIWLKVAEPQQLDKVREAFIYVLTEFVR